MEVETIVGQLGGFGRYQFFIITLTYLTTIFCSQFAVQDSFVTYTPDYRCYVASCDTADTGYEEHFLNFTIPVDNDNYWSKCYIYDYLPDGNDTSRKLFPDWSGTPLSSDKSVKNLATQGRDSQCSEGYFDEQNSISCPDGYVYDRSLFQSSATMDFDLTCDRKYLTSITTSAYNIGMLVGSFCVGLTSDTFGRKIAFMLGVAFQVVGGVLCAASTGIIMLAISRAVTGIGAVTLFDAAFVISVEFMPVKHRSLVGLFINISFALGEALVGVYAIFVRNWRALQLTIVLPSIILASYYWLLPESLRWLIIKCKFVRAQKLIEKIATVNKITPPDCKFSEFPSSTVVEKANEPKRNFLHLLRTPNMRKRSLNMFYIWIAVSMVYYGLSQNSGNLGGNIFVNFIALMLIEIPSYLFVGIIFDRVGHKTSLVLTLLIAGVSCLTCSFLNKNAGTAIVVLSLIGKFGAAGAFSIIYLYASEIFPTEYRSVGVGSCSMFGRIGGILSPFVASLGKDHESLPLMIFGVVACISVVCSLFLPETVGAPLPQTLEESEAFGSDQPVLNIACWRHRTSQQQASIPETPKVSVSVVVEMPSQINKE